MIKICIFPAKKSPAAGGMSMSVGGPGKFATDVYHSDLSGYMYVSDDMSPLQTSEIVGSTVFCSLNKRNIQYLFTLSS
jgi:hypothetical protein